jgi:tRNA (adenine22-N1)-methyltransferase
VPATLELGPRLRAIASMVPRGAALADLCCDHATLAASLVARGHVPRAIAGDLNPGPLAAAAETVTALGLDDRVELRCGDGLAVLEPGEVEAVVIAGVGALLAARLLREAAACGRLVGLRRVVVQPNHGFPKLGQLRATIDALGLSIVDERLARDRGRLYPILAAAPGDARLGDEVDRELGPVLRRGADPLWDAWLERERDRVRAACEGMVRARAEPELLDAHRRYLALVDAHRH